MADEIKDELQGGNAPQGTEAGGEQPADKTPNEPTPEEKKFSQADVERMIGERLARDRKKREEEAEQQRLLDEQKYKELYEQSQAKQAELETQIRQAELDRTKTELVVGAGYAPEKVEFIKSILHGDDTESLTAALDVLKANFPPTPAHVDPNAGNGHRNEPAPVKDTEYGKSLYDRIKRK